MLPCLIQDNLQTAVFSHVQFAVIYITSVNEINIREKPVFISNVYENISLLIAQ